MNKQKETIIKIENHINKCDETTLLIILEFIKNITE